MLLTVQNRDLQMLLIPACRGDDLAGVHDAHTLVAGHNWGGWRNDGFLQTGRRALRSDKTQVRAQNATSTVHHVTGTAACLSVDAAPLRRVAGDAKVSAAGRERPDERDQFDVAACRKLLAESGHVAARHTACDYALDVGVSAAVAPAARNQIGAASAVTLHSVTGRAMLMEKSARAGQIVLRTCQRGYQ